MPRAKKAVKKVEELDTVLEQEKTEAPAKKAPAKRKAPAKKAQPVIDIEAIKAELREEMLQQIKDNMPEPQVIDNTPKVSVAPAVDTAEIRDQIKREIAAEIEGRMEVAMATIERAKTQSKDKIVLKGVDKFSYSIEPSEDGLEFKKADETLFMVAKNGQVAAGSQAPRSYGKGSAHFKSGAPSEGVIPTNGDGSTRGIIVEGDGDDEKTFSFRAVSRMNRRGFNVFSDGALALGSMEKVNGATLGVYHRFNDQPAFGLYAPSKNLENTSLLDIKTGAVHGGPWNAITVESNVADDDISKKLFEVDSDGAVHGAGSFISNATGYAEMFEWEDRNHRGQNRVGFTVTLTETGKVRVAGEGDKVIGVVVEHAAVVGNTQWNEWKNKYVRDDDGKNKQYPYTVTEWLETGTSTLQSYYTDSIGELALPESAVETQTTAKGQELYRNQLSSMVTVSDEGDDYVGRHKRAEWAKVCLLGTVPVYKGQEKHSAWQKLRDINDELELVFLR